MDESKTFGTTSTIPIQLTFGEPKEKIMFLFFLLLYFLSIRTSNKEDTERDAK